MTTSSWAKSFVAEAKLYWKGGGISKSNTYMLTCLVERRLMDYVDQLDRGSPLFLLIFTKEMWEKDKKENIFHPVDETYLEWVEFRKDHLIFLRDTEGNEDEKP